VAQKKEKKNEEETKKKKVGIIVRYIFIPFFKGNFFWSLSLSHRFDRCIRKFGDLLREIFTKQPFVAFC